eukprot:jgi/Botrbrau1/14614/Bobra.67_2s0014.1
MHPDGLSPGLQEERKEGNMTSKFHHPDFCVGSGLDVDGTLAVNPEASFLSDTGLFGCTQTSPINVPRLHLLGSTANALGTGYGQQRVPSRRVPTGTPQPHPVDRCGHLRDSRQGTDRRSRTADSNRTKRSGAPRRQTVTELTSFFWRSWFSCETDFPLSLAETVQGGLFEKILGGQSTRTSPGDRLETFKRFLNSSHLSVRIEAKAQGLFTMLRDTNYSQVPKVGNVNPNASYLHHVHEDLSVKEQICQLESQKLYFRWILDQKEIMHAALLGEVEAQKREWDLRIQRLKAELAAIKEYQENVPPNNSLSSYDLGAQKGV